MNDAEPDDGLWFVLAECEREIYRDAPGLAAKFDRWECPAEITLVPGRLSRTALLRRVVAARTKHRPVAVARLESPQDWHDTQTVLPQT
jgi:hypothetical protein